MSGVETIIGLVLGGFPLLISAVEHYQECFQVLGCWREFKLEHRKCHHRISQVEIEFDLTLDKLFLDQVENDAELESLKGSSSRHDWAEMESSLQKRLLPRVYSAYIMLMRDMSQTMEELQSELGVGKQYLHDRMKHPKSDLAVSQDRLSKRVPSRLAYEAQRLKFSLGKERRNALFAKLEKCNKSLSRLLSQNDDVARLQSRRSLNITRQGRLKFWQHAGDVHALIGSSFVCPCRQEHCADLMLITRKDSSVHFDVLFHVDVREPDSRGTLLVKAPWKCHKAVIRTSQPVRRPTAETLARQAQSLSAGVLRAQILEKPMAKVSASNKSKKFAIAQAVGSSTPSIAFGLSAAGNSASSGPSSTMTIETHSLTPAAGKDVRQLQDLCKAIALHKQDKPCSGILTSGDTYYRLMSPVNGQASEKGIKTTSLSSVLADATIHFNRAKRYGVALAIASSHLHLHSSPWIGPRWNEHLIVFEEEDGTPKIEQPRLRSKFTRGMQQQKPGPIDDSFVTLGIILLELCFGKPLDQSPWRQEYLSPSGKPDLIMDCAAAQKWADMVEGEAGPEYADCVEWCLRRRRMKPGDHAWKEDFQQTVIEPLRASYEKLTCSSA